MSKKDLRQRAVDVAAGLPETWFLSLPHYRDCMITFSFTTDEMDRQVGLEAYLAASYCVHPTSVQGLIRVRSEEEAYEFLDLVESLDHEPDVRAVERAAMTINHQGLYDAIYLYAGDHDDLPARRDWMPQFARDHEMRVFGGARVETWADFGNGAGSYYDVPTPPTPNADLLIWLTRDDGETEVCLEGAMIRTGIEKGTIEEFLLKQLLVTLGDCAYVRRDVWASVWLRAVPWNLEYLEEAVQTTGARDYYQRGRGSRLRAASAWLHKVAQQDCPYCGRTVAGHFDMKWALTDAACPELEYALGPEGVSHVLEILTEEA